MKIIYTHTDEAPALATRSLLPIVQAYATAAGIQLELRDISLAGRILAQFPDRLDSEQRIPDVLSELGELLQTPDANVIKLHNVSLGEWSRASKSHVATMSEGDFRSTERSVTVQTATRVRIEHVSDGGEVTLLRDEIPVLEGEVLDAAVMRRSMLLEFFSEQI